MGFAHNKTRPYLEAMRKVDRRLHDLLAESDVLESRSEKASGGGRHVELAKLESMSRLAVAQFEKTYQQALTLVPHIADEPP